MRLSRFVTWAVFAATVLAGLLLLTLALPVASWRTGRTLVPPLDLQQGAGILKETGRIWIDTDAACGVNEQTDPDDCLAIALLLKARSGQVAGISTVFGNASLGVVDSTARELVKLLASKGVAGASVYRGAASDGGLDTSTPARAALRKALTEGPLTIVSLGPLTNIAAALGDRPDLRKNVSHLVAVMGHRPGHIFHPAEGTGRGRLLGHGPVFRDFNFAKAPASARQVLAMELPVTLIPYDAARHIPVTAGDLETLAAGGAAAAWLSARTRGWLKYWSEVIGRNEFYPFDLAAAAFVVHSGMFGCARVRAWIGPDDTVWYSWFYSPEALLVAPENVGLEQNQDGRPILQYCPQIGDGLKELIMSRLTARD